MQAKDIIPEFTGQSYPHSKSNESRCETCLKLHQERLYFEMEFAQQIDSKSIVRRVISLMAEEGAA